jgi:endonuclease/exonuclease/phosphatase family metal-dependent hydrolase
MGMILIPPRLWQFSFAALLSAGLTTGTGNATLPPTPAMIPHEPLSILTYNVHGLPWPIVEDRSGDLARIGQRLALLRSKGEHPSVVVLQEAFTSQAARIGALGGYRFAALGPAASERDPNDATMQTGARFMKGETEGKWEGSGLRIFSDFPIVNVRRVAYTGVCAGFDCLANKGALLVTLDVPGQGRVQVAATHLNSRAASGVPDERSLFAYRQQVEILDHFIRSQADPALPLIVAGDFNVGDADGRRPALLARAATWGALDGTLGNEALRACVAEQKVDRPDEAAYIIRRSRDFQFFYSGQAARLEPQQAVIPFGREANGTSLSDHYGFIVRYRLAAA